MNATRKTDEFEQRMLAASGMLRRYALSLCGRADKADDLVQETFCRALTARSSFDGTNMDGWLTTILKNTWRNERRKGWSKGTKTESEGERLSFTGNPHYADHIRAAGDPETDLLTKEGLHRFMRLPSRLFDTLSRIAVGYSYEDVAMMTSVQIGTVKSRVSRARVVLATA